jgi:Raf kinase inhibitor-like YbhB/YbcL family protein
MKITKTSLCIVSLILQGGAYTLPAWCTAQTSKNLSEKGKSQTISSLKLESPAFKHNGYIPDKYAGRGNDISPPLKWDNVPKGTRSFAVICTDPDAEGAPWVHWILFNIPSTFNSLGEDSENLPAESLLGTNSWGNIDYQGPTPPQGTHHYQFTLYALDTVLNLKEGATKADLNKAMDGHILAKGTLVGLYKQ